MILYIDTHTHTHTHTYTQPHASVLEFGDGKHFARCPVVQALHDGNTHHTTTTAWILNEMEHSTGDLFRSQQTSARLFTQRRDGFFSQLVYELGTRKSWTYRTHSNVLVRQNSTGVKEGEERERERERERDTQG
jgi:hypothetical protein